MQPSTLTVHEIFEKERRYTVPLFQRAYVWTREDQWEPLWEDIERQARSCLQALKDKRQVSTSHFLGAVVVNVAKVFGRGLRSASEPASVAPLRLSTAFLPYCPRRHFHGGTGSGVRHRPTFFDLAQASSRKSFRRLLRRTSTNMPILSQKGARILFKHTKPTLLGMRRGFKAAAHKLPPQRVSDRAPQVPCRQPGQAQL